VKTSIAMFAQMAQELNVPDNIWIPVARESDNVWV